MSAVDELQKIRTEIDEIDETIVPLLFRRINLALRASAYKNTREEIESCDRVRIVLDRVEAKAVRAGGHGQTIRNIYQAIITELTQLQFQKKGI